MWAKFTPAGKVTPIYDTEKHRKHKVANLNCSKCGILISDELCFHGVIAYF